MSTMVSELTQLSDQTTVEAWLENTSKRFIMYAVVALTAAFPMHFGLNPLFAMLGWPHTIGGYWDCTILVLGLATAGFLLTYFVAPVVYMMLGGTGEDDEDDSSKVFDLTSLMVALGALLWLAMIPVTHNLS